MHLSKYVTLKEATQSDTAVKAGIDNNPTPDVLEIMRHTAENLFDPIREHFGVPIGVSSFFRSPALNRAIRGAADSQHVRGQAIDINGHIYGNVLNSEIFNFIKDELEYDQLIWEFGDSREPDWVHVSLTDGHNRKMILVSKMGRNGVVYETYKN